MRTIKLAQLILNSSHAFHGCVVGMFPLTNDPEIEYDGITAKIFAYRKDGDDVIIRTEFGRDYRIIEPDKLFLTCLFDYLGNEHEF
ncbi:hypothetical protein POP12_235 [Pectobacterium phage POP12]|nr:hypothetical protein POP12_235 [Pectobacterium phage POP12]